MNHRRIVSLSGIVLAGFTAHGQDNDPDETGSSVLDPAAEATLDTAEVLGELNQYQTWPLSASAVDGETIQMTNSRDVRDLSNYVPNFSQTDTGLRSFGDVISMRGLTNTQFFGNPSVALYIDDVPMGTVASYATGLLGVDRVEVLRGPQGTLFGKNSYGGTINIVSLKPGNEFEFNAGAAYGSFDYLGIDGWFMGPLIKDKLYFRFGGSYSERDGYLDNTTLDTHPDDHRHSSFLAGLYWTPNEDWEISLIGTWDDFDDGDPRLTPLRSDDIYDVGSDFQGTSQQSANMQALRVKYFGDDIEVLSVTARRDWELNPYYFDLDLSPLPLADSLIKQEQKQWSQEIRVNSVEGAGDWEWSAGAFAGWLDVDGSTERSFVAPGVPFRLMTTTDYESEQDSFALFSQFSYKGIEEWGFHFGARLDYVEATLKRDAVGVTGPVPRLDLDDDFFFFSPRVGVDREIGDSHLAYLSTGLSFKPGGFSAFVDDPDIAAFDREYAYTVELGLKSKWWDDRVRTNAAVFYNYIRDYQVERTLLGTDFAVLNADRANTYGFEIEVIAELAEGLELIGTFGIVEAILDDFEDPVTGRDLSDNNAPFVPAFDASLAAVYRHSSGFFARVEFIYQGKTYFSDTNDSRFVENGYGLLNASIGWENENFRIAVFGQNLTDSEYYLNMSPDIQAGSPGEPQRFGVRAGVTF